MYSPIPYPLRALSFLFTSIHGQYLPSTYPYIDLIKRVPTCLGYLNLPYPPTCLPYLHNLPVLLYLSLPYITSRSAWALGWLATYFFLVFILLYPPLPYLLLPLPLLRATLITIVRFFYCKSAFYPLFFLSFFLVSSWCFGYVR